MQATRTPTSGLKEIKDGCEQQVENHFHLAIRQVKDMAVFGMDMQGHPTSWNEGVERVLGFKQDEFIGKDVIPIIFRPKDVEARIPDKELEYAAQHGSAGDDRWMRRKDGTQFYASGFTTAVRDRSGELIGFTKILRDATEMKVTQNKLQESEERLRLIMETATEYGIVLTDSEGLVTVWSRGAEKIFGFSAEEILGRNSRILFTREDQAAHYPERERENAARDGRAINERWQQRKDGRRFWASGVVERVRDDGAQPRAYIKIVRDWTEQKLSEQRLEHTVSDRTAKLRQTVGELEAFSYSIAHDMRAPLRAMQGFAGMLEAELGNNLSAQGADYLRRIKVSANRLDALIQDVLNYSKVLRSDLALVRLNPGKLISEIIESYPNLQPDRASITVAEPLHPVMANHAALTQVIANLLGNAVKFVAPGVRPAIRVWSEELAPVPGEGRFVKMWFADNGIGVPEGARARIFEMFQRLNPQNSYEGTGVGLAIVRKAIERMGGRVGLEQNPGGGSRFWIVLKHGDEA